MDRIDFLGFVFLLRNTSRLDCYSPMETLLPGRTTSSDKMITPSGDLLFLQPVGGRNVSAVRSLSGDS